MKIIYFCTFMCFSICAKAQDSTIYKQLPVLAIGVGINSLPNYSIPNETVIVNYKDLYNNVYQDSFKLSYPHSFRYRATASIAYKNWLLSAYIGYNQKNQSLYERAISVHYNFGGDLENFSFGVESGRNFTTYTLKTFKGRNFNIDGTALNPDIQELNVQFVNSNTFITPSVIWTFPLGESERWGIRAIAGYSFNFIKSNTLWFEKMDNTDETSIPIVDACKDDALKMKTAVRKIACNDPLLRTTNFRWAIGIYINLNESKRKVIPYSPSDGDDNGYSY
jgi:hypothetical protein